MFLTTGAVEMTEHLMKCKKATCSWTKNVEGNLENVVFDGRCDENERKLTEEENAQTRERMICQWATKTRILRRKRWIMRRKNDRNWRKLRVFEEKTPKDRIEKAVFVDRCNGNDWKGTKTDNPNTAKRLTQIYL